MNRNTTTSATRASSVSSNFSTTTNNNNLASLENPRRAIQRIHQQEQQRSSAQSSANNSVARVNHGGKKTNINNGGGGLFLEPVSLLSSSSNVNNNHNNKKKLATASSLTSSQDRPPHVAAALATKNTTSTLVAVAATTTTPISTQTNNNNTNNATFRRKSFAPLHLQSQLHRYLTDATPIIESWISIGLLIPHTLATQPTSSMSSSTISSLNLKNNNNIFKNQNKFLEFVNSRITRESIQTIATVCVQDACNIWRNAKQRVENEKSNDSANDTNNNSFFDLALKVCSVDFLTLEEKNFLSKCATLFDLAVPVANPSDFSCAAGVEKAVRIISEIEKLMDAAQIIYSANKKMDNAVMNVLSSTSVSNSTPKISTLLLSAVQCDEIQTLLPSGVANSHLQSNNNNGQKTLSDDALGTLSENNKNLQHVSFLSSEESKHPSGGFYFLQYSSLKGAGIRFISGSALHHRRQVKSASNNKNENEQLQQQQQDERRNILKYLIRRVDTSDGLPLYMRAAAATAKNQQRQQHHLLHQEDTALVNENENDDNLRQLRDSHHLLSTLSSNRKLLRERNRSGPLGFLPDITDLSPNELAIQVHTSEQLSREVADICRQNIQFDLFVGQPHDVVLSLLKGTSRRNADNFNGYTDLFAKNLMKIPLSEPKQYFDEKIDIHTPIVKNQQPQQNPETNGTNNKEETLNTAASTTMLSEDEAKTETPRNSAAGTKFVFNFSQGAANSQKLMSKNNNVSSSSQQHNQQNSNKIVATRAELLISQMQKVCRATEHRNRCWGIVIGRVTSLRNNNNVDDDGNNQPGEENGEKLEYIAGIVELMLSVPSL